LLETMKMGLLRWMWDVWRSFSRGGLRNELVEWHHQAATLTAFRSAHA